MSEAMDDAFLAMVKVEASLARARFPQPNPTVAALTKEVGELARALLHVREGKKGASWESVWTEAVQVAAMALRAATEGDATLGVTPLGRRTVLLTTADGASS